MRVPLFLSSTVMIATAILGINNTVYGQCPGGYCPIPNAYFDQNAPSKYGYDKPNNQNQNPNPQGNQNPYWQGNQNPNWQGNQSPDWRNDNGWRGNNTSYRNTSNSNTMGNYNSNSAMTQPHTFFSDYNGQGYYYHDMTDNQTSGNQSQAGSDKLIQHRIDDALKNNYLKKNYTTVSTRVYNGNVTISGSVDSEEDRQDVVSRIENVKGVRNVNDQMQVGASTNQIGMGNDYQNQTSEADQSSTLADMTATAVTDQDLQKLVDDTLKGNYVRKNFDNVVGTVSNGVVTISGSVDNEKERQEIRDRLQKIKGITNINDRLQITGTRTSYIYKPGYTN